MGTNGKVIEVNAARTAAAWKVSDPEHQKQFETEMAALRQRRAVVHAGAVQCRRCAEHIAAKLKVRPLLIGLTVVAMGSSAPQMTISLQAAFNDTPDIAVGSVIGSNTFNILVTLGLSALIIPLRVSRQLVRLDIPLMILASALVFTLALNHQLDLLLLGDGDDVDGDGVEL